MGYLIAKELLRWREQMKGRGNPFSVDHKIYPIGEGVTIICWFNPPSTKSYA